MSLFNTRLSKLCGLLLIILSQLSAAEPYLPGASGVAQPDTFIDARLFGVRCDGATDDSAAINSALAFARSGAGTAIYSGTVRLPPGVCRMADTIFVGSRGTFVGFQAAKLIGEGPSELANGAAVMSATNHLGSNTSIWCDFVDRPCIDISNARDAVISDLSIVGNNRNASTPIQEATPAAADYVFSSALNRQQAPYCGICVDGYAGTAPGAGVGYDVGTYTGQTDGSSKTLIKNVAISRFVVGIMLSPRSTSTQNDQVLIQHVSVAGPSVACLAIGQSQNRGVIVEGGTFNTCRTVLDGLTYGAQQGSPPKVYGAIILNSYRVFDFSAAFGSPLVLDGVHAETIKSIGIWGPNAVLSSSMNIIGSAFSIGGVISAIGHTKKPEPFAIELGGQVSITDSIISFNSDNIIGAINFAGAREGKVAVNHGHLSCTTSNDKCFIGYTYNRNSGTTKFDDNRLTLSSAYMPLSDNRDGQFALNSESPRITMGLQGQSVADKDGRYLYQYGNADSHTNITTTADPVLDLANDRITFTGAAAADPVVGDIIYWKMLAQPERGVYSTLLPACRVSSVIAGAAVCNTFYEDARYDTAANTVAATGAARVAVLVEEWAPAQSLTCDTNTSTTLTNCSPTTIIKNGDWIKGSADIPALTRVVSGGGTATLTLNKAATGTGTGRSIFFGRVMVPTTTAKF